MSIITIYANIRQLKGLMEMLKGINRRIIEINRTNNEYFEKAILFVRSEKLNSAVQVLSKEAEAYLKNLPIPQKNYSYLKKRAIAIILGAFGIIILAFCIVLFVL